MTKRNWDVCPLSRSVALGLLLFALPSLVGWSWGLAWWKTRQGNRLFADGQKLEQQKKPAEATRAYKAAMQKYRDALVDDPTAAGIHLNLGNVHYQQKKYDEALKEYGKVLQGDDAGLQAKAHYSMGNCYFRNNDLPKAIDSYKRALELDPDDRDAKYNLEVARQKLKDLANKQQQQGNDQQQQQQQQSQPDSEEEPDKQQQQQKPETKEGSSEQSKAEQQQAEETKEQPDKPKDGQAAKAVKMSKEEAERLLRSLEDEEQKAMRERLRIPVPDNPNYGGKDY